MCRLLALSSRRVPPAALFGKFKALAFEGRTPTLGPDARGHNDGWGIAGFFGNRLIHEKSALSATDPQGGWDDAIRRLQVPALWPGHFILHLRRASPGMEVRVANSHPFHRKHDGRDWFFMGNGTLVGWSQRRVPQRWPRCGESEFSSRFTVTRLNFRQRLSSASSARLETPGYLVQRTSAPIGHRPKARAGRVRSGVREGMSSAGQRTVLRFL